MKEIFIEDVREEFARDFVFPMFRANALYEGEYLLGTSIARPLIAKHLVEIAQRTGADAVAHGATGKGNDQVRFELSARTRSTRTSGSSHRGASGTSTPANSFLRMPRSTASPSNARAANASPYSMDANLLHISFEGNELEVPAIEPDEAMWRWTRSPEAAPDTPRYVELTYRRGDVGRDRRGGGEPGHRDRAAERDRRRARCRPHRHRREPLRRDESRGCYETPGGTIMLRAHARIAPTAPSSPSPSTGRPPTSRTS